MHLKTISDGMLNCMESNLAPISGYAKIGRTVPPVWTEKLHYGEMRVIVKGKLL